MSCLNIDNNLAYSKQTINHRTKVQHKRFTLTSGEYINYVDINGEGKIMPEGKENEAPTLLLTHGYGAGCGLFFSNYDTFSTQFKRVIAIDWLGMGGSSRPSSAPKLPFFGKPKPPADAVDFFIDSLEVIVIVSFLISCNMS